MHLVCNRARCHGIRNTQVGGTPVMAKALLGHVGGPDQRMAAELYRLRRRVRDLEAQLARLKEEQAAQDGPAHDAGHPRSDPSRTARGWPVQGQPPPAPRSSSSSLARPPTV